MEAGDLIQLRDMFDKLEKSFNAMGHPNLNRHGRSGMAAVARVSMDSVMSVITMQEKHFQMIKDIKKEKAVSSVFEYKVKNSIGGTDGQMDLAIIENAMPVEIAANYEIVTEPLKIYGVTAGKSEMVELVSEAGGLEVDPDKENENNTMVALMSQFERHAYSGGDYYLVAATGAIDPAVASAYSRSPIHPVRQARGIQANIREGDISSRGVSQDFLAYGNSFSVIKDLAGQSADQETLDLVCANVHANLQGMPAEAHANVHQIAEFRKQFFPFQRGDIGAGFKLQGPDVTSREGGFYVETVVGPIWFKPCYLKNTIPQKARAFNQGTSTLPPGAPVLAAQASTAITGRPTAYGAGDTVRVVVQAVSINGGSSGTAATLTVTNATEAPKVRITHQANTEYYNIFMNVANVATVGAEAFVGRVLPGSVAVGGNLDVSISDAVIRGYEPIVLMPEANDQRLRMAALGNLINKTDLGRLGTYTKQMFTSYFCFVVRAPRAFGLLENPAQTIRA